MVLYLEIPQEQLVQFTVHEDGKLPHLKANLFSWSVIII
jgi:hypothetical protein